MRCGTWVLSCCVLASAAATIVARSATERMQTPPGGTPCASTHLALPVVFQFADPDVRQDWIYRSLDPTIATAAGTIRAAEPKTADGRFEFTFCVPAIDPLPSWTATFGPRKTRIARRPVTSNPSAPGRMATAYLIDQQKPDWIIVKSVTTTRRQSASKDRETLVDVEVVNFGDDHPGVSVELRINERLDCRPSAAIGRFGVSSRARRVAVEVRATRSRLRVASADADFEEMIERRAEGTRSCERLEIAADLGTTGVLPAGPSRIRYAVSFVGIPELLADEPDDKDAKPLHPEARTGLGALLRRSDSRKPASGNVEPVTVRLYGDRVFQTP